MFKLLLTILLAVPGLGSGLGPELGPEPVPEVAPDIPGGNHSTKAYLKQLQPRDSILIADQLEYGVLLDSVKTGTQIALPDNSVLSDRPLLIARNWSLDTLKTIGSRKAPLMHNLRLSLVLAPFDEGAYQLQDFKLALIREGRADTLTVEGTSLEVKTIPIDTTSFEIHDIKGQMRYPVTVAEIAPWAGGFYLLAMLVILAVCLVMIHKNRKSEAGKPEDPAHIVALRSLDKFRSDKYWAPDKQKTFYSGVTDALKTYIDSRFEVDAPEMTTAELFAELKGRNELTPELFQSMKELFERADFVKFAKYTASDEDNAGVLPLAVRFVTSTYQTELEEEQKENVL